MLHRALIREWVVPFAIGSIILEIAWYLLIARRSYPWREMFASAAIYVLRAPARLLRPLIVAPVAFWVWSHRVTTIPVDTAWGLGLLFLGEELVYYWSHRCSHRIRWMWASHVVHHTPEQIHLASAFRLSLTEIVSGNWLFHLPLYLLGLHPVAVAVMSAINLAYQFWLHTDVVGRLGPLEWILNTPSHHRVHHASNAEYVDRNFGGIVILWDRLFGTFAEERVGTKITYGITHPLGSLNPLRIAFHEWIAMGGDFVHARTWRERLAQLFGPPGGSSGSTSVVRVAGSAASGSPV